MITVLTGPMFSSKTRLLIRMMCGITHTGGRVYAYQSKKNTRDDYIRSRDGAVWHHSRKIELTKADRSDIMGLAAMRDCPVIAIDEVNFMDPEGIMELADWFHHMARNSWLILCGLTEDSERRPWGALKQVISTYCIDEPNSVITLPGTCELCQRESFHTYCRVKKEEQELVGDAPYSTRCTVCWNYGEMMKRLQQS